MFAIPIVAGFGGFAIDSGAGSLPLRKLRVSCDIKGNVSFNTGERIYRLPAEEPCDSAIIRRA